MMEAEEAAARVLQAHIRGFLVRRKLQRVHQEYLEVVREIEGEDIALYPGNWLLSIPQFITLDRTGKPRCDEQKRKDEPIEIQDSIEDISFINQRTKSERKDSFPDTVSPIIDNYVTKTDAPVREAKYKETDAPVREAKYKETDAPVREAKYKETDGPVQEAKYKETDGPVREASYKETDGPVREASYKETDAPVREASYKETDAPVREASYKETDAPVREASYKETDAPVREAKYKETDGPVQEAKYKETDAPVREASYKETDAPVREASYKETDAPGREASYKETDAPVREASYKETDAPVREASYKEIDAPVREASYKEIDAPVREASYKEIDALVQDASSIDHIEREDSVQMEIRHENEVLLRTSKCDMENSLTHSDSIMSSFQSLEQRRDRSSWCEENVNLEITTKTANELRKLRSHLAMEMLWVQQAIASRKNYLMVRQKLGASD
ncbi:IQ domain-containing protein C [Phyllobates terribilis]|uniref:IQ domain-containing protein C n=1 Tax=Phyllobates terribilis TaxID=111132 RepID=UPI003CCB33F0